MTGEELRGIRKTLGWTLERMGDEIGLSKAFVGMMERGEKPIERRTELAARYLAITTKPDGADMVYVRRYTLNDTESAGETGESNDA